MITQVFVYRCDFCGEEVEDRLGLYGALHAVTLARPCPPEGWHVVNAALFCGHHKLTIQKTVDQVVELHAPA